MVEISMLDVKDRNMKFIDIRGRDRFLEGSIPGSINVLENALLLYPERYLDKANRYIVFCDYGNRSKRVSNYLNTIGYKVYSLAGGYDNYLRNNR